MGELEGSETGAAVALDGRKEQVGELDGNEAQAEVALDGRREQVGELDGNKEREGEMHQTVKQLESQISALKKQLVHAKSVPVLCATPLGPLQERLCAFPHTYMRTPYHVITLWHALS